MVVFILPLTTFVALQAANKVNPDKVPVGSFMALFIVSGLLYFIPSVIGILRKHHNLVGLIALNVFLGWTILGWVGALIWSLLRSTKSQTIIHHHSESQSPDRYSQLEILNQLKASGGITEEEYSQEKSKLLK